MYVVYLLRKVGNGKNQRTLWNRAGVAFGHNRDGSLNFTLDMFPAVAFQIRKAQPKEADNGHADDPTGNTV